MTEKSNISKGEDNKIDLVHIAQDKIKIIEIKTIEKTSVNKVAEQLLKNAKTLADQLYERAPKQPREKEIQSSSIGIFHKNSGNKNCSKSTSIPKKEKVSCLRICGLAF